MFVNKDPSINLIKDLILEFFSFVYLFYLKIPQLLYQFLYLCIQYHKEEGYLLEEMIHFILICYNLHFIPQFIFFKYIIFLESIFLFLNQVFSIDLLNLLQYSVLCFILVEFSSIVLHLESTLILYLF